VVRPGEVIQIADPVRAGARRGGRISSATTTVVTVDDATGLTLGSNPLRLLLPVAWIERSNVAVRQALIATHADYLLGCPFDEDDGVTRVIMVQRGHEAVLGIERDYVAARPLSANLGHQKPDPPRGGQQSAFHGVAFH